MPLAAIWPSVALAFALGLRHALDADHVAAVGTLVASGGGMRRAARLGAAWGAGHAAAVSAAGLVIVALDVRVPPPVATGLDFGVAAMLLAIGGRALFVARRARRPRTDRAAPAARTPRIAAAVGVVHGLAGTTALALAAVAATPSRAAGAAFVAAFAGGAMISMTVLSAALAWPMRAATDRWRAAAGAIPAAAGALSIVVAGALVMGAM